MCYHITEYGRPEARSVQSPEAMNNGVDLSCGSKEGHVDEGEEL
jgi:hypothetical protein